MDSKEIQNLGSELRKLQFAWSEKFSSRARGGRIAISGFRYQFFSFLYSLVFEWLSYSPEERSNIERFLTEMEALSDIITVTKGGLIIATQSKITLRSSSLYDALDEFKTIHETAEEVCPLLIDSIRYKVLCSKIEIKEINNAFMNWKAKQQSLNKSKTFVDSIEIVSESAPDNCLLALLANNFKCSEPLKTVYKWIGLIVDGIHSHETMSLVGKNIWDDLSTLWRGGNDVKESIYVWQDTDFPPDSVRSGPVLIGQRPNVSHLRKGYFSPRTNIYKTLEDSLMSLIESLDYSTTDKVPIYWIGGRSGSGKSVALLHLLSNLNEKGHGPIIWVGHQTSLLCPAMRFALESELDKGTPIIGVDDPYVVGAENNVSQHWEDVFALLHLYRQKDNYKRLPIFVACGPTEQAYLFKDDYCEYLEFNIKELPQESKEENDLLRVWYHQRTGNEPPIIEDRNTLMVQLFFQWDRHEPILEFAKRLKDRLIQGDPTKGIYHLVSKILSLNRLYIGYAPEAVRNNLTLGQKDLLEWLEIDLHLGERETKGMNGYWLLHAHLANALYLNWFENRPASFIEHIKAGIIDSIAFGISAGEKSAPLWAISRVFRQTKKDELLQRLDENTAIMIVKDIYKAISTDNKIITISMLPVWVEIYSLKPELQLFPSPIEIAIEAINPSNTGETGLRLVCHKVMQYYNTYDISTQQKINNAIVEMLANTQQWIEWSHLTKNALIVLKDERLIPMVTKAISSNLNNPTAELLYLSLKKWPENECLRNFAINTIFSAPCTYFWIEVANELIINSNQVLHSNIINWFGVHKDNKYICFALKEALRKHYIYVRDIAMNWSNLWYFLDYASFILEPLLQFEGDNEQVIDWCRTWLVTTDGDKSFMLQKLLNKKNVSPDIIQAAVDWLNNVNPENPSWIFVWQALYKIEIDGPSYGLGLTWLQQNDSTNNAWPYIWSYLFKTHSNDAILIELGIQWIRQKDLSHLLWGKMYQKLLKAQPKNIDLITIGKKWLEQEDISYNAWPYIWQNLYSSTSDNSDFIAHGKHWLRSTNSNHPAWVYVWNAIIKDKSNDLEMFDLGVEWIEKIETSHWQWRNVWNILIHIASENSSLLDFAEKWLKSVDYNTVGWYHVWKRLYKSKLTDKKNLLEIGRIWLTKVNQTNSGWVDIWDSVYKSDSDNIRMFNLGVNFLRNINMETGVWSNTWLLLIKAKPQDEFLFTVGNKFIKEINSRNGSWCNVWLSLTKVRPRDNNLFRIGMKYVSATDLKNSSWQYIWMRLFDLNPKNTDSFSMGVKWLQLFTNINGAWPEVFLRLMEADSGNVHLLNLGELWLEKVPLDHSLWSGVWLSVLRSKTNNEKMLKFGVVWLKQTIMTARNWPSVWVILTSFYPNDNYLLNIGLDWISENSDEHPCWGAIHEILDKVTACK